jgi:copper homeostasis protein
LIAKSHPLNFGNAMSGAVLIEICVDSIASAVAAERGGASRVELCADLLEGGVTPSAGLTEAVRARLSIGLHLIIRPRPGDFCYEDEEIEIMRLDIAAAKNLGADGVVLGVLDAAGNVDVHRTRELVELARPLSVTFHRAFDMSEDLFRALEDVCTTGADRILTSGGEPTCMEGVDTIGRISIMAGGGILPNNAASIVERTGVREIHAGLSSSVASPMQYRKPDVSMGEARGREYQRVQVVEEDVRKLKRVVSLSKA